MLNETTADAKSGLSSEPASKFPTPALNGVTAISNVVIAGVLRSYRNTDPSGDTRSTARITSAGRRVEHINRSVEDRNIVVERYKPQPPRVPRIHIRVKCGDGRVDVGIGAGERGPGKREEQAPTCDRRTLVGATTAPCDSSFEDNLPTHHRHHHAGLQDFRARARS